MTEQTGASASGYRSVAAGGHIGSVSTGDHVVHLPPQALDPPECPPGLIHLPPLVRDFVGREGELALLNTAFSGPGDAVVQALHGLGGVGKSSLAAHWAATRRDRYEPVWWITAESEADVNAGLAALGAALRPPLAGVLQQETLRERALSWLGSHDGWLIVLDDVTDPRDIQPLLARVPGGRFLITTRLATGWHTAARAVRLDVLRPEEAEDLFIRVLTEQGPRDTDGAAEVCAELGHLPLAVDQAAAYCAESGTSPREYLELLARYPATLYAEGQRAIGRTWRVTLDRLTRDQPLTGDVLRVLAWYASDDIPRALLAGLAEPPALLRAVGGLVRHSMIRIPGEGLLSVHRLVQDVSRTADENDPHRRAEDIAAARRTAIDCLNSALPADVEQSGLWPVWWGLLPHIEALDRRLPPGERPGPLLRLLHEAGAFVLFQGVDRTAIRLLTRCRDLFAQFPAEAEERPDLAWAVSNSLGHAYLSLGDEERGLPCVEEAVAAAERYLDAADPRLLRSRLSLANALQRAGRTDRSLPLMKRVLADTEGLLGPDHNDTHWARASLGSAYYQAGRPARAIRLLRRALHDRERLLGRDHPSTAHLKCTLAQAYQAAGETDQAVPLMEEAVVALMEQVGPEHQGTVNGLHDLGDLYLWVGRADEAVPVLTAALEAANRVMGGDHPRTLAIRHGLAVALGVTGDRAGAARLLQDALDVAERVHGSEHRLTRDIREALRQLK